VAEPIATWEQLEQIERTAPVPVGHEIRVSDGATNELMDGREAGIDGDPVYARVSRAKHSRHAGQQPRAPFQHRQQVRTVDTLDDETRSTVHCHASERSWHGEAAATRGHERHLLSLQAVALSRILEQPKHLILAPGQGVGLSALAQKLQTCSRPDSDSSAVAARIRSRSDHGR
jgi:hypothetical protein